MKRILIPIALGAILLLGIYFLAKPAGIEIMPPREEIPARPAEKNQPIKIILAGDIMLDRGVEYMVETEGNGDFRFPFLKIADYFQETDIVLGNLEGIISDKGSKVGSIYSFRAEPEAVEGLISAGLNVLSLANNHALDYGREALEDCLDRLSKAGIAYAGAGFTEKEAFSPFIKEINGVRIAFLAYTNLGPKTWRATGENSGIAWISDNDLDTIKQDIKLAKEKSDVLIVSLHSGEEYQKTPSRFQINFSKMAIEAGADLAVGHHPHVVQPSERYQNGWIFYSLGNFIFDQGFSEETMESQIVELLFEDNEIKGIKLRGIRINNFFQPHLEISSVQHETINQ